MDSLNLDFSNQVIGRHLGQDNLSRFHNDFSYLSSETKFKQRDLVLAHFQSRIPNNEQIRLLSMPGESWLFETMVAQQWLSKRLVTVEHSWAVIEKSRGHVGIRRRPVFQKKIDYGHAVIDAFHCPKRVWLLHCRVSVFAAMLATNFLASIEQKEYWNKHFCRNNAVWLDFTGSIGEEILICLKNLRLCIDPFFKQVPIAFTFMYGRDGIPLNVESKGLNARKDFIEKNCPGFKASDAWYYEGMNKCPMCTVIGFI